MAEGDQETSESQPVRINPEILTSLGLSQDDVDRLNKEKLQEERELENLRIEGAQSFKAFKTSLELPEVRIQVAMGTYITANTREPDALPDTLMENWAKFKGDSQLPEVLDPKNEKRIKAFLGGFGQQALNDGDWRSALNALDISTDGGIMQNEYALGEFKKIAKLDKMEGVDIAKAIQERINKRPGGFSQPEHRPAPPNPSGGPQQ